MFPYDDEGHPVEITNKNVNIIAKIGTRFSPLLSLFHLLAYYAYTCVNVFLSNPYTLEHAFSRSEKQRHLLLQKNCYAYNSATIASASSNLIMLLMKLLPNPTRVFFFYDSHT